MIWKIIMSQSAIYITYASEGGNAKLLAEDFAKRCQNLSFDAKLFCLNDLATQGFAKSNLICFVSTTGNGEVPSNGRDFLNNQLALSDEFDSVGYALFALGSRSYSNFCGAGKKLNQAFMENNASAIAAPVYADENFLVLYEAWALSLLSELSGLSEETLLAQLDEFARKPKAKYKLSKKLLLTNDASVKETYHLVFDAIDEPFQYNAGDVVSITPTNIPYRVRELLSGLKLESNTIINYQNQKVTLFDYLQNYVEITKINANVVKKTGALLNDWELLNLASDEEKIAAILTQYDVLEWFLKYPIPYDKLEEWLLALVPISPRSYSVASDGQDYTTLHLCVGLQKNEYSYATGCLRQENGLGSGFLCEQLEYENSTEFYLESHPGFHLQTEQEMIWVATGTGIAPFIGFLSKIIGIFPSERPKITLYFGIRDPKQDFIYQEFLESCHQQGIIELKMAFSRTEQKSYVQDWMQQDMAMLAKSISQQSHLYVCGSLPMWDAVETVAQHAILEGCDSMEQAKQSWEEFVLNRLHKDIY